MFGEPYDGLIVGSIVTLVTSVVILIITNRAAERQWNKQRIIEEQTKALEQVYTPLYFTLWDLCYDDAYLSGLLSAFSKRNFLDTSTKEDFLQCLEGRKNLRNYAKIIKKILVSKLGVIYPLGLRDDLFYFLQHIEDFERNLFSISSYDFRTENIANFVNKIHFYGRLADYQANIALTLADFIKNLIDQKGKAISDSEYINIFDIEIAVELQRFLSEPNSDLLLEKFETFSRKHPSKPTVKG